MRVFELKLQQFAIDSSMVCTFSTNKINFSRVICHFSAANNWIRFNNQPTAVGLHFRRRGLHDSWIYSWKISRINVITGNEAKHSSWTTFNVAIFFCLSLYRSERNITEKYWNACVGVSVSAITLLFFFLFLHKSSWIEMLGYANTPPDISIWIHVGDDVFIPQFSKETKCLK